MNLKATFYLKNCGRGPTKNVRISMLHFKKNKIKKNTWRYHYFTPVYEKPKNPDMIYGS